MCAPGGSNCHISDLTVVSSFQVTLCARRSPKQFAIFKAIDHCMYVTCFSCTQVAAISVIMIIVYHRLQRLSSAGTALTRHLVLDGYYICRQVFVCGLRWGALMQYLLTCKV